MIAGVSAARSVFYWRPVTSASERCPNPTEAEARGCFRGEKPSTRRRELEGEVVGSGFDALQQCWVLRK
jgi:hypothetical protein